MQGIASLALSIWRGAHFRLQSRLNQGDGGCKQTLEKLQTASSKSFSEGASGEVKSSLDEKSSLHPQTTSHVSMNRVEAVNRRLAKDSIDVKEAFKKHREELKKRQRLEQQREKLLEKSSCASAKLARRLGLEGGSLQNKRMKTDAGVAASSSLHQSSSGGGGGGLKSLTEEDKEKQKKVLEKILSVRSTIQEHVDKVRARVTTISPISKLRGTPPYGEANQ